MELGGQGERGYAMATLLVGMALMAIFMSAALPAWSQLAQREKEAEYLFRANQYALAVKRFQDKMGGSNSPAPSVDFLVEQKFLRKKYKDPLSGKDFVPVLGNQALPGLNQQPNQNLNGSPFGQQPGQTGRPGQPGAQGPSGQQTQPSQSALATGRSLATDTLRLSASDGDSDSPRPLTAVTSSFKGTALRQFKGQMTTYDQWVVTVYDVPLHLGGRSIGSHLVSGPGTNNLQNQNGRPPQGNGGNPFGNGSTGGNPFSGSGGFGGAGTGGFGGAGSGGFGGGTGGFGAPNQQGTSVFPPPPSSPKPQQ